MKSNNLEGQETIEQLKLIISNQAGEILNLKEEIEGMKSVQGLTFKFKDNLDLVKKLSEQMEQMEEILFKVFNDDEGRVSDWLHAENPHFGNSKPLQLWQTGRGHKVLAFIENAFDEIDILST